MDKLIYFNKLFDIYGNLFTENQKDIFKLYYEENLSLQEIADLKQVSRAFVSKSINQTEDKLEEYESYLKCLFQKEKINVILELNDLEKIKTELKKL